MLSHSRNASRPRPRHRSRPTLDRLEERLQPNNLGGVWNDLALSLPTVGRPRTAHVAPARESHVRVVPALRDTPTPSPQARPIPVLAPHLTTSPGSRLATPVSPAPTVISPVMAVSPFAAVNASPAKQPAPLSHPTPPARSAPTVTNTSTTPRSAGVTPTNSPAPTSAGVTSTTSTAPMSAGVTSTSSTTSTAPSFASDGDYTLTNWGPYGSGATAIAMWNVPNSTTQRIMTAGLAFGSTSSTNRIAVARYNTDGTFDTSYGSGGVASNVLPSDPEYVSAMALQTDGKAVVAGGINATSNTNGDVLVARYTVNGALDTTFNGTGWVSTDINRSANKADAVGLQSTGKIVAAGHTRNSQGYDDSVILRYTSAGRLDNGTGGFGQAGKGGSTLGYTVLSMGSTGQYEDEIDALAIQPDDKIVTVGSAYDPNYVNAQLTLMRFNANGSPDTTFHGGSPVLLPAGTPGWSEGFAVTLQADGKIVVAGDGATGNHQSTGFQKDFLVARYNPDGTPDTSFNNGSGSILIDISSGSWDQAHGVAVDGSGRIVVGGSWRQTVTSQTSVYGSAVARLNPDGTLDTSYGTNGVKTGASFTTTGYDVYGLAVGNDGGLLPRWRQTGFDEWGLFDPPGEFPALITASPPVGGWRGTPSRP
jgi:uncharacterized delta-60 repeat protein